MGQRRPAWGICRTRMVSRGMPRPSVPVFSGFPRAIGLPPVIDQPGDRRIGARSTSPGPPEGVSCEDHTTCSAQRPVPEPPKWVHDQPCFRCRSCDIFPSRPPGMSRVWALARQPSGGFRRPKFDTPGAPGIIGSCFHPPRQEAQYHTPGS